MYVDAADSSSSAWALRIAKPSSVGNTNTNGSINIIGYYSNVDIVPYIFVGATVYKFGRTTGGTVGGVTNTCEDTMVDPYGDPYTVICAVRVETAGIGTGDSGGPVYYPEFQSDPTYAIGIVFEMDGTSFSSPNLPDGGSYYCTANCKYWFSAMDRIQSHLNRYFSF